MPQGHKGKPEPTDESRSWDEEPRRQKPGLPHKAKLSTIESEILSEKGESNWCHPPRTATASTMDTQDWDEKDILVDMRTPRVDESGEQLGFSGKLSATADDAKRKRLQKYFNPRKQLRKLLLNGLCRWGLTAILILCLYMTLLHYSAKSIMSRAKKLQFNALITGLSIGLGLSIADSLKEMALTVRWWILSRRKRPLHEVDLILNVDSPSHILKLLLARPRLNTILAISLWLLLNLGAQVGVALLGLTYSVDSADSSALTIRGNVSVPDLRELATEKVVSTPNSKSDSALQYTANSFGTLALALGFGLLSEKPSPRTQFSNDNDLIFLGDNYAQYVYYEASPDYATNPSAISIATNRTSNSTGTCKSWPVIEGGDGSSRNITYMLNSSGDKGYASIPLAGGLSQTTYVTQLSKTCGEGCGMIYALEASAQTPFFYECNVTVGQVVNVMRPEHELGIDLRNLASTAIALQGYAASSLINNTDVQFQSYPAESIYGSPQNGNTTSMALLMAEFAMGVVAVSAQNNPTIIIPGDQPQAGVMLNVTEWKYVHLILGLTGGLQLFLFLITAFVANRVVVKDKSYLAIAKLLSPIVQKVGSSGSLASGKEISDLFGEEEKFIYSVEHVPQGDVLRIDLGQRKPIRGFPEGKYE